MAAFFNFHLSTAGALAPRATLFGARRDKQRRMVRIGAAASRAAVAAGEIGMFFWLILANALLLLVMAGFFVR